MHSASLAAEINKLTNGDKKMKKQNNIIATLAMALAITSLGYTSPAYGFERTRYSISNQARAYQPECTSYHQSKHRAEEGSVRSIYLKITELIWLEESDDSELICLEESDDSELIWLEESDDSEPKNPY